MIFELLKDKIIRPYQGDRYIRRVFVKAGTYPIVRVFDKDRVMVDLNYKGRIAERYRKITLLRIDDGEIIGVKNE